MTTFGYTLSLGDTEYMIVRDALKLLQQKCRTENQDKPRAPYLIYEAIIPEILAKLEDSAHMTSTSSFCWGDRQKPAEPEPDNGAVISECGNYRYKLWRIWDATLPVVTFIGLNPSTADASVDDQTVRRCTGLTKKWGYGGFQIVNLFAYRSTDPKILQKVADPIGPENDRYISEATDLSAAVVIAAWGEKGGKTDRANEVLSLISRSVDCLGYTKDGYPSHPSRLGNDIELVSFPRKP